MANWTEKELEELMAKMTKKAMTDAEFRKEVLADANKALEKLAGKPLPEGASLKCVERDPNYQTTLVLPDLLDEEKLDDEGLSQVAGGINVALIVTVCAAAVSPGLSVGPCGAQACWGKAVAFGDACGAQVCDGETHCIGHACGSKEAPHMACSGVACSNHTCADYYYSDFI